MSIKLGSFRTQIMVEDPQTGEKRAVKLKVKRMSVREGTKFARDYNRSANPESNVMLARTDAADEQAKQFVGIGTKDEHEEFVMSASDVARRRLLEMSDETRALYDRLDASEEEFSNAFIEDTLTRYIRVEPDQGITSVDDFENDAAGEEEIRSGADLAKAFGGHPTVVRDLLRIVHLENSQDESAKKVLRSVFGFVPSSVGHETARVGGTLDLPANSANKPGSVVTVDADPNTTAPLSGSEVTE